MGVFWKNGTEKPFSVDKGRGVWYSDNEKDRFD